MSADLTSSDEIVNALAANKLTSPCEYVEIFTSNCIIQLQLSIFVATYFDFGSDVLDA